MTPTSTNSEAPMAATLPSARGSFRQRFTRLSGVLMSLNDPNWGRRPGGGNQGPPDLEELWRNLTRKLQGLFGGRGGDSGPGAPRSPRRMGGGIGLLAGLVVL